jgi:Flp pilus assembly protein CpaB
MLLALVLGTGGAVYRMPVREPAQAQTVSMVIATHDLHSGSPIGWDDVAVRRVDAQMVPDDATFGTLEDVVGRIPRERVLRNEILRTERLARRDAGIGLSALVAPCKVAIWLTAAEESVVAPSLEPGDFVGVYSSDETDAGYTINLVRPIVDRAKVLAAGSRPYPNWKNRTTHWLVVELTMEQALALAEGASEAPLFPVLRHDLEMGPPDRQRCAATPPAPNIEPSPHGGIEPSPQGGPYRTHGFDIELPSRRHHLPGTGALRREGE